MREILIVLIGLIAIAAPVFGAAHVADAPVVDGGHHHGGDDDGCGEQGNHGGDHEHDDDCDDKDDDDGASGGGLRLISESALLNGLGGGALFPFIDTTPNKIVRAHIAITDATETCEAGVAPPGFIAVLVGSAGVSLVSVMNATTNTGIGNRNQCVFHVTVVAGVGGIPANFTDIVIVNSGEGPLTGYNTVTVTAEVQ